MPQNTSRLTTWALIVGLTLTLSLGAIAWRAVQSQGTQIQSEKARMLHDIMAQM